jgi:hypothetical protein
MHIWAVQKALNPKNWMTQFLLWFNQLSFSWWSSKNKCTQLLCSHNCFTKEFKIQDHLKNWEMENFTLIIIQYAPSSSSLFYVFKILNSMIKECNLTDANFLYAQKTHMKIYIHVQKCSTFSVVNTWYPSLPYPSQPQYCLWPDFCSSQALEWKTPNL